MSLTYPCGFCGQTMRNGSCALSKPLSGTATSKCPQAYGFRISSASQISETKPCTNVPLRCLLCPTTDTYHWKYNMRQHLDDRHPDWRGTIHSGSKEFRAFQQEIAISSEEEARIGIPEAKHGDWSVVSQDMYDRRRMNYMHHTEDCHGASPTTERRIRASPGAYGAPVRLYYNHSPHTISENSFSPSHCDVFS